MKNIFGLCKKEEPKYVEKTACLQFNYDSRSLGGASIGYWVNRLIETIEYDDKYVYDYEWHREFKNPKVKSVDVVEVTKDRMIILIIISHTETVSTKS